MSQATNGNEVEDADQVVRRRVIRTFLVVPVKAVEVRDNDPDGQGAEEEHALQAAADRVGDRSAAWEEVGRQCERERQPSHVG